MENVFSGETVVKRYGKTLYELWQGLQISVLNGKTL